MQLKALSKKSKKPKPPMSDPIDIGQEIYGLMVELYPICRSITGDGVRKTLRIISKHIPLKVTEVPTGIKVLDWTVPREWNIKDAYIKNSRGEKIIDFKHSNLHVLNYSVPVSKTVNLEELKKHIFTLPQYPDRIPYRTSYYQENWGFCMTHHQFQQLKEDTYKVVIDSELKEGSLTFGEFFLEGNSKEEILFSCYLCHPSLCNDNLSGIVLLTFLAKSLLGHSLKYSYRFLFIPETIGSITWLSLNEERVENIKGGLVATCVGDPGSMTYKKSRKANTLIDKTVEKALIDLKDPYKIIDFFPSGSDERQFCSPGFNLPIGSLMRTPYGQFSQYHTSADNLDFVEPQYLGDSFKKYEAVVSILEKDSTYLNLNPKCEPQLGKRGLYSMISGFGEDGAREVAMLWVLNLSDGNHSLLDIAIRSQLPFERIREAADALLKSGLLKIALTTQKEDFTPMSPCPSQADEAAVDRSFPTEASGNRETKEAMDDSPRSFTLRQARKNDCKDLWVWRNHPEVRKWCFNKEGIPYGQHKTWFEGISKNGKTTIFIIQGKDKEKLGQVRFDGVGSEKALININLNPKFFNRGIGTRAIQMATRIFLESTPAVKEIIAEIFKQNAVSKRAFQKAEYLKLRSEVKNNEKIEIFSFKRSLKVPENASEKSNRYIYEKRGQCLVSEK